jgi:predicted Zn-dependent protease
MSQQGVASISLPPRRIKAPDPLLLERLAETGFLATEFGMHERAEEIFTCLRQLRPGKPSPIIALAMVHARRGLIDQAIEELNALLESQPDCEIARAVLGTMLVHARRPGALELFEKIIADGTDAGAISIANCCVELARKQEGPPEGVASSFAFFRHYNVGP